MAACVRLIPRADITAAALYLLLQPMEILSELSSKVNAMFFCSWFLAGGLNGFSRKRKPSSILNMRMNKVLIPLSALDLSPLPY